MIEKEKLARRRTKLRRNAPGIEAIPAADAEARAKAAELLPRFAV